MNLATMTLVLASVFSVNAIAAPDCSVIESNLGTAAHAMVGKTIGSNIFFEYRSDEVSVTVASKDDMSSAFVLIESVTANPKQQVDVTAGKDGSGKINVNAELNGQTVIVECEAAP